jgi:putative transcriptional regulator
LPGEDFVALEDHLVFESPEVDASLGERLPDRRVARERLRLVVAIGVDGVDEELRRNARNLVAGETLTYDQRAAALRKPAVELDEALADEFHTPVGARGQSIEDFAIEHENAEHFPRIAQRMRERRVIEVAKIAAKPDERPVQGGGRAHGRRVRSREEGRQLCRAGATFTIAPMVDAMGAQTSNFTHHFLIAMPAMADPHFSHTLTYVCEHNEDGALGIVINKPTDMTLSSLFEQIDVPLADAELRSRPVHFGGPVQVDRGFVLHRPLGNWQSTLAVDDEVGLTTSKDVLEAVARGEGPRDVLISLGYAGWSAGQLEQEIAQNAWLTVAADPEVLFDLPVEDRLPAAMRLLGIDFSRLSDDVGHA